MEGNFNDLKEAIGRGQAMNINDLEKVLRKCFCKETAYPRCQAEWVADDPTYGQCAITAMIVHDYFGGTIHRIKVEGGGTHYFNKIDGKYIDLTREQFDLYNIPLKYEPNEEMPIEYCGKNPDTKKRYEILKSRVERLLKEEDFLISKQSSL